MTRFLEYMENGFMGDRVEEGDLMTMPSRHEKKWTVIRVMRGEREPPAISRPQPSLELVSLAHQASSFSPLGYWH